MVNRSFISPCVILRIYRTCFLIRERLSQTQQQKAEDTERLCWSFNKLDVLQHKEKDLEMESRL